MRSSGDGRGEEKVNARSNRSALRDYIEAIVFALVIALVIKAFIVQTFKVDSGSMIPTLVAGDQILVNKFTYGTRIPFSDVKLFPAREPKRGEIVVFEYPNNRRVHYIKRLIGLPRDVIEIRDKLLYVNGERYEVESAHYDYPTIIPGIAVHRDNLDAVTVPADSYFVMGDNRDNSSDSRSWGYVKGSELVGNAVIIYWSWDISSGGFFGRIKNIRWSRLGDVLLKGRK
ncbi:MAG: signal peptidase I [Deltaproteobacteria bacterium]|uniref:Signal peptidase I n=1 Tax=Candidatus Zymogenus saltonus TaxID=2844893 RepID=A0A9D8KDI9_9DELT|nr:signal peptidase I [Candidatus Zymogenus saltonus]